MSNLQALSDDELLNRIIRAERQEDRWQERALRACHYCWWEVDDTPRGQEAHHTRLFWGEMKRRLYAEEDRRGGQEALYARLRASDKAKWRPAVPLPQAALPELPRIRPMPNQLPLFASDGGQADAD